MEELYESTSWIEGICHKFGNIKCYPMFASLSNKFILYTFEKLDKLKIQIGNKSRIIYFKKAEKMKWMDSFRTDITGGVDRWKFENNTIPFWVNDGRFTYVEKDKEQINKLFYALFI
jgi:hypothetical protein